MRIAHPLSLRRPVVVAGWSSRLRWSALALAMGAAVGLGILGVALQSALPLALGAVVFVGVLVAPLMRVHAKLSAYFLAFTVLWGLLIEFSIGHSNVVLTHRLRLIELALLLVAAAVAAIQRRRPLPAILLLTPVLLALVDIAAFLNLGFNRAVLTGGLNLYLHYFVLAVFVYYSSLREKDVQAVLLVVGIIALAIAALALAQILTGRLYEPFLGQYYLTSRLGTIRAIGIFAWPVELAMFAGSWFFVFYARAGRSGRSLFYTVVCIALFICVVVAVTRTVLVVLIGLLILIEVRRLKPRVRLLAALALVVLGMALMATPFGPAAERAYSSLGSSSRGYYLVNGLQVWRENPIVGVGLARYATDWSAEVDPSHVVLQQYGIEKINPDVATTDSFAASLLPEFGLLGTTVVVGFLIVILAGGTRWGRCNRITAGYAWTVLFIALSAIGSAQSPFAPHMIAFWIAVGMLARNVHATDADPAPASSNWPTTATPH